MVDQPTARPDGVNFTPRFLRQEAERSLRIAANTFDTAIHDALMSYAQELLDRAEKMEAARDERENLSPVKPSDLSSSDDLD
jgi:hypothetical protein